MSHNVPCKCEWLLITIGQALYKDVCKPEMVVIIIIFLEHYLHNSWYTCIVPGWPDDFLKVLNTH